MISDMSKVKKPLFIKFDSSLTTSQRQCLHELAEKNNLFHENTETPYKRLTIYLKTDFHDSRAKRLNFGNGNLRIEQMLNISSCSASSVEIQQHDNVTTVLNSVINNDTQKRKRGRPKKNSDSKAPKYNRLIHQNLIL
jgi:spore coat protein U-like protein